MIVHSPKADLNQLIGIARVCNKYSFKSLETWALDAIQEYVNRKPSPILALIPAPTSYTFTPALVSSTSDDTITPAGVPAIEQLTRLIRLAQMCNHDKLLATMIGLLRQLMSLSIQYAYLAMTLADELDLRALRGAAYLEVMQKAVVVRRIDICNDKTSGALVQDGSHIEAQSQGLSGGGSGEAEGEIDNEGRLVVNPSQQLRLLSGYYRLTSTWEHFRLHPPHFDHAPSCGATWHQHGCTQSWLEFWKDKTRSDAVMGLGLADVLGRLRAVAKEFDRWGSATYMHHDCRMAARRCIQEGIKSVEDRLPDFFSETGS